MHPTLIRIRSWLADFVGRARKKWWWFVVVAVLGWLPRGLFEDRIFSGINAYIDQHGHGLVGAIKSVFSFGPFFFYPVLGISAVVVVLLIHAYVETRPSKRAPESGCEGGPQIHLIWDVPKPFASLGVRRKKLIIENRSEVDAYHLKIDDVCIDMHKSVTATFPGINMLARKTSEVLQPKIIGNVEKSYVHEFEMVWANSSQVGDEFAIRDSADKAWLKIPLIVTFKDYDGKYTYRSLFELWDDIYTLSLHAEIRFVSCTKIRN